MLYLGEELEDEIHLTWNPQRHWLISVVQESHHDIGYTDLPQHVFEQHNCFMDEVLDFCNETAEWPEESKFRHTVEQSSSILNYVKNRPKEVVDKLMKLVREGRIEVVALYGNEVTSYADMKSS